MSNILYRAADERRVGYSMECSRQLLRALHQASPKSSLLVEGSQGIVQIPITAFLYSVDSTLVEADGWVEWLIRLLAPRAHVEQFAQFLLSQLGTLPCSAAERDVLSQCHLTERLHLIARCQHPACQRAARILNTLPPQ